MLKNDKEYIFVEIGSKLWRDLSFDWVEKLALSKTLMITLEMQ